MASPRTSECQCLLRAISADGAASLPTAAHKKRGVLLAERGFIHVKLMQLLTPQLGWYYRLRFKSNSWIYRVGKGWCQLKDFHFNRGEALCLHNVRLHKGVKMGVTVNLQIP
ncbi:hypothetical protein [Acaryochloris sp. IP29b_bin.137]|uniref:hypothetical protein n=1 Tax=Acaryochloris sp. IP29b_bin.137 TaxID=2969217 RepID=UPI0026241ADF|nr:hypothetical protein [Acaryochloris sp. IP29b_bin.137]